MKIVSWNVNGIRACHRKGEFLSLLERLEPDLLCIQETKAWPEQLGADLLEDHGYHVTWAVAEKKGYSGVATFSKTTPDSVTVGFDEERFDREGRVITTIHGQVAVVNAYFPNGQRDHARLPYKTDFYRRMLAHGQSLEKAGFGVVICGDWNTAHHEIDLKNWRSNRKTSGFTEPERALITEFAMSDTVMRSGLYTRSRETDTPGGLTEPG